MKEVFRHSDAGRVSVYQSLLEGAGIQTFFRNSDTQQAIIGGLMTAIFPVPEFWPTLCVVNDADYFAAMEVLRDRHDAQQSEWSCPKCTNPVPEHFLQCWNCGFSRNLGVNS